jgi:hypothetical protein
MFKKLMLATILATSVAGAFVGPTSPVAAFEAVEHGAPSQHAQLFEIEDFSFDIEQQ